MSKVLQPAWEVLARELSPSNYSLKVVEWYQSNPPFTAGRSNTKEERTGDMVEIIRLIGHCMVIGDDFLLDQFLFGKVNNLVAEPSTYANSLKLYIDAEDHPYKQQLVRKIITKLEAN